MIMLEVNVAHPDLQKHELNENEKLLKTYEEAWAKAKKAGDEISAALYEAAKATTTSARHALEQQARQAVEASDYWRHAAEGFLERVRKSKP